MTLSSLRSNSLLPQKVLPWGNFSNTPTGTYTGSDGFQYKYVSFTSSGSLVVTDSGYFDVLVVSGGSGSTTSSHEGGGAAALGIIFLPSGTLTATVGAGGAGGSSGSGTWGSMTGTASSLDSYTAGLARLWAGAGATSTASMTGGITSLITGSSQTYAGVAASPRTNFGEGKAGATGSGSSGVVIVRVRTN